MNQLTTHTLKKSQSFLRSVSRRLGDAGPLLLRATVGVMFAQAGWGKLQHLDRTIGYFDSLGIPAAHLQAPLVANVEFIGGLLLVLGLGTRLAAVPLAVTMVVAIITAQLSEVSNVLALLSLDEAIYLAVLLTLAVQGPGKASLDALLSARLSRSGTTTAPGQPTHCTA